MHLLLKYALSCQVTGEDLCILIICICELNLKNIFIIYRVNIHWIIYNVYKLHTYTLCVCKGTDVDVAKRCGNCLKISFFTIVEKEMNFGDHGYARRTPLPGLEDDEDANRTIENQEPCTQCQLLKKQLEQEMQHSARLQKEVWWLLQSTNGPHHWFRLCKLDSTETLIYWIVHSS